MNSKSVKKTFDHSGSSFDEFLEEEGIRTEVEALAAKRVLAWQIGQEMKRQRKTKRAMAQELHTSRSQVDRLLDPNHTAISLLTVAKAATALGKRVTISMSDAPAGRKVRLAARRKK